MKCVECGKENGKDPKFCSACGAPFAGASVTRAEVIEHAEAAGLGMKWYKFLIYFALFASCLANVASGVLYVTGSIYGIQGAIPELVYVSYPALKVLDIAYGILLVLVGVLCVAARHFLAKFDRRGITLLLAAYVANPVLSFVYFVVDNFVIATTVSTWVSVTTSVVGSAVVVYANWVYFTRRKRLFVL